MNEFALRPSPRRRVVSKLSQINYTSRACYARHLRRAVCAFITSTTDYARANNLLNGHYPARLPPDPTQRDTTQRLVNS